MNPGPVASVTVTFNTTAVASDGTPTRPATGSARVDVNGRKPAPANAPSAVTPPGRVSSTRCGVASATKPEPAAWAVDGGGDSCTAQANNPSAPAMTARRCKAIDLLIGASVG